MERSVGLLLIVCVIAGALADLPVVLPCVGEETKCAVTNVVITPCPLTKGHCVFHMGDNATITFDITPEFSASQLKNEVSHKGITFPSLDSDACLHASCPVTPGVTTPVSYTLLIRKKGTAIGSFDVKWKVWNDANSAELCCFQTKLKIEKARRH